MGKHRISLRDLRRILKSFGVSEDPSGGTGSHTLFFKEMPAGYASYPVPTNCDPVLPCYVKGARKRFSLLESDGITDEDFFGRA
jgi:hypothetical protein